MAHARQLENACCPTCNPSAAPAPAAQPADAGAGGPPAKKKRNANPGVRVQVCAWCDCMRMRDQFACMQVGA